jgi:hypothetical protein
VLVEVGVRADDDEALGPGEALELGAHQLPHGAATAVAADEPRRLEVLRGGLDQHRVALLGRFQELGREIDHRVREGLQLLEEYWRQLVLLEVEAIRIRRDVGDQAEVPLDDHALAAVAGSASAAP